MHKKITEYMADRNVRVEQPLRSVASDNTIYYLAYGSNCNVEQMGQRCPGAKPVGTATISGWQLAFSYYANVIQQNGSSVMCGVWAITPEHLESLDEYEGFPTEYTRVSIPVQVNGIGDIQAVLYHMTEQRGSALEPPPKWYGDVIREGYEAFHIPIEQMISAPGYAEGEDFEDEEDEDDGDFEPEHLQEVFGLGSQTFYYFAYGSNSDSLRMKERCPSATKVSTGSLDGYQMEFRSVANVFPSSGKTTHGVVYRIKKSEKVELDKAEGVNSRSYAPAMLPIRLQSGKTIRCLVYIMTDYAKTFRDRAKPSLQYEGYFWAGYREHGIPTRQINNAPGYDSPERRDQRRPIHVQAKEKAQQEREMADARRLAARNAAAPTKSPSVPTKAIPDPLNENAMRSVMSILDQFDPK